MYVGDIPELGIAIIIPSIVNITAIIIIIITIIFLFTVAYLFDDLPSDIPSSQLHEYTISSTAQHRLIRQHYQIHQAIRADRNARSEYKRISTIYQHLSRGGAHIYVGPIHRHVHTVERSDQATVRRHLIGSELQAPLLTEGVIGEHSLSDRCAYAQHELVGDVMIDLLLFSPLEDHHGRWYLLSEGHLTSS